MTAAPLVGAKLGRVLIVAGSDSGGGAGIQADIKTVTVLGGYAATALTALTAQNTRGVTNIVSVAEHFVREQMACVLSDIGADAVKTGMLPSAGIIETVAATLQSHALGAKLVVDPVMVAKGGARLIDTSALGALKDLLISRATVVTPNIPEAEELAGMEIRSVGDMERAAGELLKLGSEAVVVKGGHLDGPQVTDVLAAGGSIRLFRSERIATRHTHGTGCTFASALATRLAAGCKIEEAVCDAVAYVGASIRSAPGLGGGHGPLGHLNAKGLQLAGFKVE